MILQELHKLALREALIADTAFGERAIHFVVRIDANGAYRGLEPQLDERGRPRRRTAPKEPVRSMNVAPAFLVDNAQYTLGLAKAGKQPNADVRAAAFDALVAEAAAQSDDAALHALVRFLARRDEFMDRLRADAPTVAGKKGQPDSPWSWTADEVVAFALVGEIDRIDERATVRDWWRARRVAETQGTGLALERCLVTGALAPGTTEAHSKLKGVPEGNSTGTSLVSCNAPAFETHGQSDTGPISALGAESYIRALNWLLERQGERRFRQGVLLDASSVVLFWTREPNAVIDALLDLGGGLFDVGDEAPAADAPAVDAKPKRAKRSTTTPEDARRTFESPWRGLESQSTDDTALFALTLGGNSARAVVRDWMTSTAGDAKRNLRAWFDDLRIEGDDGRPMPLRALIEALRARPDASNDKGELAPDLASRLFRAAIGGAALPSSVLPAAVQRFRLADRSWRRAITLRAALVRCALNRAHRGRTDWKEITVSLDSTNRQPGYVLGRLFAVLEHMQLKATGHERDLSATIRDRYFGAASSAPAVVFPRLLGLSVHHASKLAKDGDNWLERQKGEVMDLLDAKPIPATLDLEQQGLFAIGYYHQRQERFRPRAKAAEEIGPAGPEGDTGG